MSSDEMKRLAAARALDWVEPGMKLGLGTGSSAAHFVALLGAKVREEGLDVLCVPTSEETRLLAEQAGLRLTTLDEEPLLDLVVDGADEIDDELRLIKGGGGALLREKIVATASAQMIVIADASKRVKILGAFPLPVEVVRFGLAATREMVAQMAEEAGCRGAITVRSMADGAPYITDGGNVILDCAFGRIDEPEMLDEALRIVPGVVESGLFLGIADMALIGGPDGVTMLEAEDIEDAG